MSSNNRDEYLILYSSAGRLEETLEQPDSALLPRHAVRDAGGVLELRPVLYVPPEVPEKGVLVGVLRPEAQLPLGLLDRDERVLRCRLVDPLVERRKPQLVEDFKAPDRRRSRESYHLLAVAGIVEYGLIVLLHRRELFGADVEGVVHLLLGERKG